MADKVSLSVRVTRAWWMSAAIGLINAWARCGLPVSERMLELLIGGGLRFETIENVSPVEAGGCAPPVHIELPPPPAPERTDMILEGPAW